MASQLADAHAALADAEATAALLAEYMRASGERRMWDEWLAFGEAHPVAGAAAAGDCAGVARVRRRQGSDLMDRVAGSFERVEGLDGADEYLDLLDRVLLDRKISGPERGRWTGWRRRWGCGAPMWRG